MEPIVRENARVSTADGDLDALIHYRPSPLPQPGLVLVDGSGEGTADGWGGAVDRLVSCGTVVLTHDKPGCGASPGDWRTQSLSARADESLAAAALLRSHPAVAGMKCGLYGVSQGGWVALIAAALDARVQFVISNSGPGVSPAFQDRFRILNDLRQDGQNDISLAEAGRWLDDRANRLLSGQAPEEVLTQSPRHSRVPWRRTRPVHRRPRSGQRQSEAAGTGFHPHGPRLHSQKHVCRSRRQQHLTGAQRMPILWILMPSRERQVFVPTTLGIESSTRRGLPPETV